MRYALFGLIAAGMLALACAGPALALSDCEKQEGFVPLFDGKDMEKWVVMGDPAWSVQNGILVCSGQGHRWLRSKGEFKDFVLRLEFRISPGGNSGVFVRATEGGNPAFTGMELQIMGDHNQAPGVHSTASVYDAIAPSVNLSRPAGDWNSMEITLLGSGIAVALNGRTVVAADLSDKELNAKLAEDVKFWNRAKTGFIGVQNHGSKVEFRDVRIRALEPMKAPANP